MKQLFAFTILTASVIFTCQAQTLKTNSEMEDSSILSKVYTAKNESTKLSCELTSPELKERKATVIASLKKKIIRKEELPNGYAYKFPGTEKVLDELTEFIKTERACCSFFIFNLSISGDQSEIWFELTGPEGAKEMIVSELGL